jgi:tetratricopeptide (TPR) repeat protein
MTMKSLGLFLLAIIAVPAAYGQALDGPMSPAQQRISWAQAAILENGERSQPYNDLAAAYVRRVRETADTRYYDQAQTALEKSLQISPDNFEAHRTQITILIGRHEFAKALELAKAQNKMMPDDVMTYGLVADADIELGNYKEAERAAQWMLDIRPGNVPGLLRGARLRQLFGDSEGAKDFYSQSYPQLPPTQTEDLAWILTQMAGLDLSMGNLAAADKLLQSALDKFPNYYLAIEAEARLRLAQQQPLEAVKLLRQRNHDFPTLESQFMLAGALDAAGQAAEASASFSEFERAARLQIDNPENANAELVRYYLGRGKNPAEALRIAHIEIDRRHDVETFDAYAWSLYANGEFQEARKEIASALAVGVRNADFFYHAGAIAARLDDGASAARFLNESLQLNPTAECAGHVREELEKLRPGAGTSSASL